jgi:geranylgeranyl diphosphate synthase type II
MSSKTKTNVSFSSQLESKVKLVNKTLGQILSRRDLISKELEESVRYAIEGPGKRIRSCMVLWCCELIRGKVNRDAQIAAAAIEMVHTYSLIHDDLPAMDDDDYRRGRLTSHRKFDEATAILAGDALLTLAFEVLAKEIDRPKTAVRLISELAEAAGPAGMVAGQMADMRAAGVRVNEKILRNIHTNKTAKMFRCAAAMGGICGGADRKDLKRLREYGLKVGLGFQIADDILDVSASSEQLGKTTGKDAKQGKATYPSIVGLKKSRETAEKLAKEAVAALKSCGKKSEALRQFVTMLLDRTK